MAGWGWPSWGGFVLPGGTQGPPVFPGRGPQVGCVPFGNIMLAYEFMVTGLANPFALNWVPVGTIFGGVAAGEIVALGRTVPLPNASNFLHPGDGGRNVGDVQHWHHISISVQGAAIFPAAEVPERPEGAAGNGHHSTLAKARITLALDNSRTRTFDVDIGAGVEIDVKCRSVEMIQALVPDPTSLPAALPEDLAPPGFNFVAIITTCVTTCEVPQGYKMPAKYSQAFFAAGGDAGVWTMPVMPSAHEVEIFTSDPASQVSATFLYVLTPSLQPSIGTPTPSVPVGSAVSPPLLGHTPRIIIPGNANAINVSRPGSGAINVVQLLNV